MKVTCTVEGATGPIAWVESTGVYDKVKITLFDGNGGNISNTVSASELIIALSKAQNDLLYHSI